ncbi:MAG TPA: S8 family serine peptidase [Gemmatimonadota bacterium]|nr:S8 family serine peptidase [Gemmatimonadota bacterium]
MPRPSCRTLAYIAALGLAFGCERAPTSPSAPEETRSIAPSGAAEVATGRVLVRYRSGVDPTAVAAAHGLADAGRPLALGIRVVDVPAGRERTVAAALARDPRVEFAEPDRLRTFEDPTCPGCTLPDDGLFGYKWDLHNDGEVNSSSGAAVATTGAVDADMDWLEAFDGLGSFSGSARVAILDTGVRTTHEDLVGRVVGQYDFVNGDGDATDDQGHGTHVAGIAAAGGGNGVGLTGVAYGTGIGILAAKVCSPTFFGLNAECPSSAIVEAIAWAVEQGADVINLSLGGTEGSEAERQALAFARANGVLPVCAAGNSGVEGVLYPAAFPECVAVSATDWGDELASYSNWGPEVELSAPGGDMENSSGYSQIASTCFGGDNEYCLKAGTSMATPQAAGLAALLFALGLEGPEEVLARMRDSTDDLGAPGRDDRFGHGRLNVVRAVEGMTGGEPGNARPTADFTVACDGLSCAFTDASADADGSVVAWSWTFGDGSTSTERNPVHAYACAGDFTVVLTVTDDAGATGSVARVVSPAAPGGTPGEPSEVPGLVLWLRADAITGLADGEPVATWPDGSGHCNHATQSADASRPRYRTGAVAGRPAVEFDAVDDGMATPVNPGVQLTIVAAYASRAGASGYLASGGGLFFLGPYVGRYRNFTGGYASGPKVEAGRWVIQTLRQDAVDELFIDGAYTAKTTKLADPGVLVLGRQGLYSQVLDGTVAEFAVWDRALTDAELATVHEWMIGRYLPPPGANAPPVAAFDSTCDDLDCAFTDTSSDSDGTVVGWSWSFGDGGTSTVRHPVHAYAAEGDYAVTLTVTDDAGATDAVTRTVSVSAPPVGGPFEDPSSLDGLVLWLSTDALAGLADGDPVATWPDASGAGNDASQSTASKRPLWVADVGDGRPALFFDADDGMATGANPPLETTVLVVYASRAAASGRVLNGGYAVFMGPYVGRYRNYTSGYVHGPAVEAGRWVLHGLRQSSGVAELHFDGAFVGSTTKTADPGAILLASQGIYGNPLDGWVAEVLVYDRALTDAELDDVEAWLMARHGIP